MNFSKLFGKGSQSKSSRNSTDDQKIESTRVKSHSNERDKPQIRESIHTEAILNLYPVDASNLLTASQDRTLVLYDFVNHRIRRRWTGHEHDVYKVLYGRNINLVVSSSRDRTIRFWNPSADAPVQTLCGHDLVVTGIDLNPENTVLVSGSRDNKVIFWDVKTGQILKTITIGRNLGTDIKWSYDGTFVIQTGEDKEIKLFDGRSMMQSVSFPKKQYIQISCDISKDNLYILWDVRQRKLITELYSHRATVNSARFIDQTASTAVSCSNDGRAILWDIPQNTNVGEIDVDRATPLTSIVTLNAHLFAVSALNGKINFIERSGRQLKLVDRV